MATAVSIDEAETHLLELLQRVCDGEEVIITVDGEPVALLSPLPPAVVHRVPGKDAGTVVIMPDFDEPLPEFAAP